jgi:hypothetical protein
MEQRCKQAEAHVYYAQVSETISTRALNWPPWCWDTGSWQVVDAYGSSRDAECLLLLLLLLLLQVQQPLLTACVRLPVSSSCRRRRDTRGTAGSCRGRCHAAGVAAGGRDAAAGAAVLEPAVSQLFVSIWSAVTKLFNRLKDSVTAGGPCDRSYSQLAQMTRDVSEVQKLTLYTSFQPC